MALFQNKRYMSAVDLNASDDFDREQPFHHFLIRFHDKPGHFKTFMKLSIAAGFNPNAMHHIHALPVYFCALNRFTQALKVLIQDFRLAYHSSEVHPLAGGGLMHFLFDCSNTKNIHTILQDIRSVVPDLMSMVNERWSSSGCTPLASVLSAKNEVLNLPYLMSLGPDLSIPNEFGQTPLMLFFAKNRGRCYHELFYNAINRDPSLLMAVDLQGRNVLFYVQDSEAAENLIRLGADINQVDKLGRNALFYQNAATIRICLTHGMNPMCIDKDQETPISHHFCKHKLGHGPWIRVNALLQSDVYPANYQHGDKKNTLLHMVAAKYSDRTAEYVVSKKGTDTTLRNACGFTALYFIVSKRNRSQKGSTEYLERQKDLYSFLRILAQNGCPIK